MCGDLENEDSLGEEFYLRFSENARRFLSKLTTRTRASENTQLYAYLDALLRRVLGDVTNSSAAPEAISGFERLRMEPLVYARIAGFIAAHQPLDEDPLKRLIEALMTGYAEGEALLAERAPAGHAHSHTH